MATIDDGDGVMMGRTVLTIKTMVIEVTAVMVMVMVMVICFRGVDVGADVDGDSGVHAALFISYVPPQGTDGDDGDGDLDADGGAGDGDDDGDLFAQR